MTAVISPPATRISFVRHGHVKNPFDIFYGRLPGFELDRNGQLEAARAAAAFKECSIDAVYSSPMLRAQQTANEILKFHPRLKLKTSSLITEVYSVFQGQPSQMLAPLSWDVYAGKDPKYEQPDDVMRRAQQFIRRIRKQHCGGHVAAVTHGDVILFLVFWANKIPVTAANKLYLAELGVLTEYPATGSITTLTYQTTDMEEIPKISHTVPPDKSDTIDQKGISTL